MSLYAHDISLLDFDFNFSDCVDESFSLRRNSAAFLNSAAAAAAFHAGHGDEDYYYYNHRDVYADRSESRRRAAPPPRKHRHDGSSPLPLGMDWSPPPRKLEGRDSVWPHDPRTGWSYCVVIPSWNVLRKSRSSDPIVCTGDGNGETNLFSASLFESRVYFSVNIRGEQFYRVEVGIQSPEGVTTVRAILRRFNNFLNLFSDLKKAFPKKDLPPAPPKKVLRKKNQELLEERRCALEDWMQKLLSDIDLSRSLQVAMFLELEAAVRSSFSDVDQSDVNSSTSDAALSILLRANSDVSAGAGNSSITSDYGDETPYEISEHGTTKPGVSSFTEFGTEKSPSEQDLIDSLETNIGLPNRNVIQETLQNFSRHKSPIEFDDGTSNVGRDQVSEDSFAKHLRLDGTEFVPEIGDIKQPSRVRRLSTESVGSDLSSVRASEFSNSDVPGGSGAPINSVTFSDSDFQFPRGLAITLPSIQRHKLNSVLRTFQQRLATAKTDMEDLIARLDQEVAVRQFLTAKVKDLEVELETTTQNCKENMQQTVLNERERITQMQWDMEELRSKCMELELKLKSEEEEKLRTESAKMSLMDENKRLLQELNVATDQLDNLQKRHGEFELKSKADVKLLVKEVKSLRNSQSELKQELSRVMKEKLEVERALHKEKQRAELSDTANAKLLHECKILIARLQECSVNFLVEEEDKLIVDASLPSDAIDLLTTSDNRIGLLLAETQLLAQEVESCVKAGESNPTTINGSESLKSDDELRKMLTDILVDNATLRIQVNSVIRCALKTRDRDESDVDEEDDQDEASLRKTVLGKFLER